MDEARQTYPSCDFIVTLRECCTHHTRSVTLKEAMNMLVNIYSSKTRSHVITLKKKLSQTSQYDKLVDEYLQQIRIVAVELTLAQSHVSDEYLVILILNGLSPNFHEIFTAIWVRETSITYEEFHEKLADFEAVLKQYESIIHQS